jgi:F0F1-type ATP synthase epsilon subunit
MAKPQIKVKIQNREKVLFEGSAYAVSSINDTGEFSILPYHANFITLLKTKISVKDMDGNEKKFAVDNGVLRVENNSIEVFLGVKIVG